MTPPGLARPGPSPIDAGTGTGDIPGFFRAQSRSAVDADKLRRAGLARRRALAQVDNAATAHAGAADRQQLLHRDYFAA